MSATSAMSAADLRALPRVLLLALLLAALGSCGGGGPALTCFLETASNGQCRCTAGDFPPEADTVAGCTGVACYVEQGGDCVCTALPIGPNGAGDVTVGSCGSDPTAYDASCQGGNVTCNDQVTVCEQSTGICQMLCQADGDCLSFQTCDTTAGHCVS
jgi:hypothetical protein